MFCPPVTGSDHARKEPILSAAAGSLVTLRPASLPLLALKQSADKTGFVIRTCDFSGEGGTLKLGLPKPVLEAAGCDLVEAGAQKLDARGQTVTMPLNRFSPATLKVQFSGQE